MNRLAIAGIALFAACETASAAQHIVSCAGFAMLGAAQMNCSHVVPKAPAQFCTFSWSLHSTGGGQKIVDGSFLIPPGAINVQIYQGSGFDSALGNPIVLCRGRKSGR